MAEDYYHEWMFAAGKGSFCVSRLGRRQGVCIIAEGSTDWMNLID